MISRAMDGALSLFTETSQCVKNRSHQEAGIAMDWAGIKAKLKIQRQGFLVHKLSLVRKQKGSLWKGWFTTWNLGLLAFFADLTFVKSRSPFRFQNHPLAP